ncbi:hypothetical protein BH11ACT5_BH11ACT5_10380 [soil metagenome]
MATTVRIGRSVQALVALPIVQAFDVSGRSKCQIPTFLILWTLATFSV